MRSVRLNLHSFLGLSTSYARQVALHFLVVFLVAFGTTLSLGAAHVISANTAWQAVVAAAAAGVVAVVHAIEGLIPAPLPVANLTRVGVALVSKSTIYTVAVSVASTFLVIFGAQLAAGAAGIDSLPDVKAVLIAAISAAVSGVVTYVTGLIPTPKPTGAQ